MKHFLLPLVLVISCCAVGERPYVPVQREDTIIMPAEEDEIRALIEQMVMKDPPPVTDAIERWKRAFDCGMWDGPRWLAIRRLRSIGKKAIPSLLESLGDERLSSIYMSGVVVSMEDCPGDNVALGKECLDIIVHIVEEGPLDCIPGKKWWNYRDVDRWSFLRHEVLGWSIMSGVDHLGVLSEEDRESIRKWWQTRKKWSMLDMRIEALEWEIRAEKKALASDTDFARPIRERLIGEMGKILDQMRRAQVQ